MGIDRAAGLLARADEGRRLVQGLRRFSTLTPHAVYRRSPRHQRCRGRRLLSFSKRHPGHFSTSDRKRYCRDIRRSTSAVVVRSRPVKLCCGRWRSGRTTHLLAGLPSVRSTKRLAICLCSIQLPSGRGLSRLTSQFAELRHRALVSLVPLSCGQTATDALIAVAGCRRADTALPSRSACGSQSPSTPSTRSRAQPSLTRWRASRRTP